MPDTIVSAPATWGALAATSQARHRRWLCGPKPLKFKWDFGLWRSARRTARSARKSRGLLTQGSPRRNIARLWIKASGGCADAAVAALAHEGLTLRWAHYPSAGERVDAKRH